MAWFPTLNIAGWLKSGTPTPVTTTDRLPVDAGLTQPTTPADTQPVSAVSLPLPDGAAEDATVAEITASLGTDGATPPTIAGTGVRGWLRAIYERLTAGLGRTWTLAVGTDSVSADAVRRATLTRTFNTSTAGTVIALTPTSGKKLRVSWYSLQAGPDNGATVTAAIRFGVAGADVHTIDLSKYGQMFAHSFGGAEDYIEGAVDESLYLFTSADQRTILNLDYKEV